MYPETSREHPKPRNANRIDLFINGHLLALGQLFLALRYVLDLGKFLHHCLHVCEVELTEAREGKQET